MARIPTVKRISQEEFPDQKWIGKLLGPLNNFMEQVVDAFNKALTVSDNMAGTLQTIEISGYPYSFRWTDKAKPTHITVGACNRDLTDAPYVNWTYDSGGGLIKITSVTGITPTTTLKYQLTLTILTS